MAKSPISVTQRFRSIQGCEQLAARAAALPDAMRREIKPAIEKGADLLVAKIKEIAPVSELEAHPGALRDSVHREPGGHDLAAAVVEDAKDAQGRPIAKHVEFGHHAADGTHVPARRHFWIAYRVIKPKIRNLISRAMTAGIKKAFPRGV